MSRRSSACTKGTEKPGRWVSRPGFRLSPGEGDGAGNASVGAGDRRDQRRDPAQRDATVFTLGLFRLDLEILLAITLRHQVLRRDAEDVGERPRNSLGATIRQDQIRLIGADGVGVAFDQEGLARVLLENAQDRLSERLHLVDLAVGDLGGANSRPSG